MTIALVAMTLLLAAAIAVQVFYARTYWAQANGLTKVLWVANTALLSLLAAGVLGYAVLKAVG